MRQALGKKTSCYYGEHLLHSDWLEWPQKATGSLYKIFCGAQPETHDAETLKRMQYGSEQEINAVAMLVAKVLPVYFPHTSFYEEDCYVLPNANDTGKFAVSIRQTIIVNNTTSTIPVMGVEIEKYIQHQFIMDCPSTTYHRYLVKWWL